MRNRLCITVMILGAVCGGFSQTAPSCCPEATKQKQQWLWEKLEAQVQETDKNLDGVMGVSILDLTSGQTMLWHADEVFAQASSIKIAVLAELYRQAAQGKLKLTELYTVRKSDMVQDGDIYNGLTPGCDAGYVARSGNHDDCGQRQQRDECADRARRHGERECDVARIRAEEHFAATQDDGREGGIGRQGEYFYAARDDGSVAGSVCREAFRRRTEGRLLQNAGDT